MPSALSRIWLRIPIACFIFIAVTAIVPRWWCGRYGRLWYNEDVSTVTALARDVADTASNGVSMADFTNDDPLFKGEWQFGTYQMTALGLLQVIHAHPECRNEFLPVVEASIDRMLLPDVRAFDTAQWHEDALSSLDGPNDHAAYLGYLNVVLGLHRRLVPISRFNDLNDRISAALDRRLVASSHGILKTYPSEAYPMDNVCVVTSLILHSKNTAISHHEALERPLANLHQGWIDPSSGLLYQAVDARSGRFIETGRASGTAFAATILSLAERDISPRLYQAVKTQCTRTFLGFGYVNEYPHGQRGRGDVDSGPLIFGISPSGTAFSLGASRAFSDRDTYVSLYRTAHLMGTPTDWNKRRTYVTGGPLGNAILLAMLTTVPDLP